MVPLIFTLKNSFINPFGFVKKLYDSVQYIGIVFFMVENFDNMRTTKF